MARRRVLSRPFLLALALAAARSAAASWPADPAINLPVCVASGEQGAPRAVSDGAGGILIAWKDDRAGGQIFAQHVTAEGVAMWAPDGQSLGPAGATSDPMIVPDGAGGAVIAWLEDSGTARSLEAQRLAADGSEQWAAGGVVLRQRVDQPSDPNESRWYWDQPVAAADGAGGMYFCFQERHDENNALDPTLYTEQLLALHCDATGAVVDERVLDSDQYVCRFCGDGYFHMAEFSQLTVAASPPAGLLVAYRSRGIVNHFVQFLPPEIHAQEPIAGWSATVVVAPATTDVRHPRLAVDGSGGAIVSWEDTRAGAPRLYAARVTAAGAVPWSTGGVAVSAGAGDQLAQEMTPDGQGGVVLAWLDLRSGGPPDVYAQRLDALGAAQWPGDVAVCAEPTAETQVALARVADGAVAIAWRDTRSGTGDLYGRFVSAGGVPLGAPDGAPICNAAGDQDVPAVVEGGPQAIVAWRDHRSGTSADVYAQRFGYGGPVSGLGEPAIPHGPSLSLAGPTPSRGPTRLAFELSRPANATLWVTDPRGRRVKTLASGAFPAGPHAALWDGRDESGRELGSGVFFVVLDAQGERRSRRVVMVR